MHVWTYGRLKYKLGQQRFKTALDNRQKWILSEEIKKNQLVEKFVVLLNHIKYLQTSYYLKIKLIRSKELYQVGRYQVKGERLHRIRPRSACSLAFTGCHGGWCTCR